MPPSRHLVNVAAKNRDSYANAVPFPHIALDGLFPPATPKRMLLVVHSHHGIEEVNQSAAVLRRSRGNWIVTQFDLLVLESHQEVPLHLVRAAAAAFPHERRSAVHLPAADDWRCGHFSALERARAHWEDYSLVFLTNSDVMITPLASHRLETLVTDRANSKAAFFVTQWRRTANAYNTDAFLFRPHALNPFKGFFGEVCKCPLPALPKHVASTHETKRMETRCVAEAMLYNRIHRAPTPLIAHNMGQRAARAWNITGGKNAASSSRKVHFRKEIDHLGLWHTHDPRQVDEWLQAQPLSQPLTVQKPVLHGVKHHHQPHHNQHRLSNPGANVP